MLWDSIAACMSWLYRIVYCFHINYQSLWKRLLAGGTGLQGSIFGSTRPLTCARSNHLGALAAQWSCWYLSSVSIHIGVVLSATWFTLPTWGKNIAPKFWSIEKLSLTVMTFLSLLRSSPSSGPCHLCRSICDAFAYRRCTFFWLDSRKRQASPEKERPKSLLQSFIFLIFTCMIHSILSFSAGHPAAPHQKALLRRLLHQRSDPVPQYDQNGMLRQCVYGMCSCVSYVCIYVIICVFMNVSIKVPIINDRIYKYHLAIGYRGYTNVIECIFSLFTTQNGVPCCWMILHQGYKHPHKAWPVGIWYGSTDRVSHQSLQPDNSVVLFQQSTCCNMHKICNAMQIYAK